MSEINYEKKLIRVQRNKKYSSHQEPVDVYAYLVGGEEGVFAAWKEGDMVYMAAGDDGCWWEIDVSHKHWIPYMISCLQLALDSK